MDVIRELKSRNPEEEIGNAIKKRRHLHTNAQNLTEEYSRQSETKKSRIYRANEELDSD